MPEHLTSLLFGSGGREDALSDAHERSPEVRKIIVAPGNDFMTRDREKEVILEPDVRLDDPASMVAAAKKHRPDIVEIGPEVALAAGAVDALQRHGFSVFGPSRSAALLETDKAWARQFMRRAGITTPRFEVFGDPHLSDDGHAKARAYAKERFSENPNFSLYFKASGICGGKGALKATGLDQAFERIEQMSAFGEAGETFVVEDAIEGEEFSGFVISGNCDYVRFKWAQDNKRSHDGDRGEQTGGMGAVAPTLATKGIEKQIDHEQFYRTVFTQAVEDVMFEGVLYLGGIRTPDGKIVNVEFNTRWGDPEAQVILPGVQSDYVELIRAVAEGQPLYEPKQDDLTRVCIVGASNGYPGAYDTGFEITGLARASQVDGVEIFGAAIVAEDGKFYGDGGRVLNVVGAGEDTIAAREKAMEAMSYLDLKGSRLHYRTDIGHRDVDRLRQAAA